MNETITVTETTDKGLEYHDCPNNEYDIGDTIPVKDTIDIFISGELCNQYVEYLEIVGIDREFVIDEKEWYMRYNVDIVAYGTVIKNETLYPEDLDY